MNKAEKRTQKEQYEIVKTIKAKDVANRTFAERNILKIVERRAKRKTLKTR